MKSTIIFASLLATTTSFAAPGHSVENRLDRAGQRNIHQARSPQRQQVRTQRFRR